MKKKSYYVYILTNYTKTVLYIGITNNLTRRLDEHKKGLVKSFSKQYKIKYLVYFEETNDVKEAITREKQLKRWNRTWKNQLITQLNPKWEDLSKEWY